MASASQERFFKSKVKVNQCFLLAICYTMSELTNVAYRYFDTKWLTWSVKYTMSLTSKKKSMILASPTLGGSAMSLFLFSSTLTH